MGEGTRESYNDEASLQDTEPCTEEVRRTDRFPLGPWTVLVPFRSESFLDLDGHVFSLGDLGRE